MYSKNALRKIATATALGLMLATTATAADAARPRHQERPAGQWTRHTEGQRTATGRQSHSTFTNHNGKQATRDVNVERNAEAGTRTRTVVDTGPNGGQRSLNDVTQRTDNGYTREQTVTRANGSTASRHVVVTKDAATGVLTKDVTVNGGASTP